MLKRLLMIDFDDHGHLFEESVVSSDPMTWAMLASDAENQAADAGWDFHKTRVRCYSCDSPEVNFGGAAAQARAPWCILSRFV
jgi:hypothetical protein